VIWGELTGLFGVTRAIARVFGVINSLHLSTDGVNPFSESVGKEMAFMPRRLRLILFKPVIKT
jgi:hypothetical protein